jgi:ABC-type dipeptide/oligopeptide/nickel transport system permease component
VTAILQLWSRNRWWLTRVAALPVQVLVFAAVVFFVVRALPGDAALAKTGGWMTPDQMVQVRKQLGLSGSVWRQFSDYLAGVAHLDLGVSISTNKPVSIELLDALPPTLELAFLGLLITFVLAVLASYWMLIRPRGLVTRILKMIMVFAGGLPDFVVAILFIFIFYTELQVAPAPIGSIDSSINLPPDVTGFPLLDALLAGDSAAFGSIAAHLVLPVAALAACQSPVLMRLLSHALHEAVNSPTTQFRISCGVSRRVVILSVFRRALPATASMLGTMFGTLISGAVVLEQLFGLPGLGKYVIGAIDRVDFAAVRGFLVFVGLITLLVYLAVDLVNMLLDPRRRPGVLDAE